MDRESLGRYEIDSLLGSGGMGAVYAARDGESGERVALKVLSGELLEDEQRFRRFEQEVSALGRLDHPNIVRLVGPIERDETHVFFAMELLEGKTLSARIRETGPMPVPTALALVRPLLEALAAAHREGVIHRDIKPSNILLVGDRVVLTDFGLARMDDITRLTQTGQLMGTLDYMSPEQCEGGEIDGRSDLYSVGIILYEMLTGTPPFRKETPGAILKGHLTERPSRLDRIRADLPGGLADVVERLLAKEPDRRYPSAEEALAALSDVPDPSVTVTFHPGTGSGPVAPAARPRRRFSRRPVLLATGALLLAAAVAAGVLALTAGEDHRYPSRETANALFDRLHRAMARGDWDVFESCFEPEVLAERFPGDGPDLLRSRLRGVTAFDDWNARPVLGGGAWLIEGPALPAALGLGDRSHAQVVVATARGGFRIQRVAAGRGGGGRRPPRGPARDALRRVLTLRLDEFFGDPNTHLTRLLARLEGERGPTAEKQRAFLTALRREAKGAPIPYRVLPDESEFQRDRARVVIRCPTLMRVWKSGGDEFEIVLRRTDGRQWTVEALRPRAP